MDYASWALQNALHQLSSIWWLLLKWCANKKKIKANGGWQDQPTADYKNLFFSFNIFYFYYILLPTNNIYLNCVLFFHKLLLIFFQIIHYSLFLRVHFFTKYAKNLLWVLKLLNMCLNIYSQIIHHITKQLMHVQNYTAYIYIHYRPCAHSRNV